MENRKRKKTAPIVATVCLVLYYVLYFGFLISLLEGGWRWAFGLFPVAFSALMIKVCVERIREIEKGEEDDLSQY